MNSNDPRVFQFPQVYIVEASAGSGKTYCLARRYLQLLINPYLDFKEIPLNTILAITFTNKAALEMKERILEFLKKIALDKFSNPQEKADIIASLGVSEEEARDKAFLIMDELLRNYNFFQVQTIDSFINAILSGCAFKLDLSANFKTQKVVQDYLSFSLDQLIDQALTDKNLLAMFYAFLEQYINIENKTSWFPKKNILDLINNLFSQSNKFQGEFVGNGVHAKDLIVRKKSILKLFNELNNDLPQAANKRFVDSLGKFVLEDRESFSIEDLSTYFKYEEFPVNKGGEVSSKVEKLWAKIREELKELCELESASIFNYYLDIFNHVLGFLKTAASKDDVLFLESLNKEARGLFDENAITLPELYYRLACRFKHFLLDEFQDTSKLQWNNIEPMVEEALSTRGSLFCVGDKKQAIYRFRGGEAALIDWVRERFKGIPLIDEVLSKNYRSAQEIVEFNNEIFSQDNLKRFFLRKDEASKNGVEFNDSDLNHILEVFQDDRQEFLHKKTGGYVQCRFLDFKNSEEAEAARKKEVLGEIAQLRKRFALGDIALLARKNDEVELLTSWLLENKIPVESEKTLNIRSNARIKELISLLKFLDSPIDNVSFASFILGDIFSASSGLSFEEIQDFILGLQDKKNKNYLYREFRQVYPKIWDDYFEGFFKSVGFVPLYELVVTIFSKFKIVSNFSDYQGFFMKVLELIREVEEETGGLKAFLEYLDKACDEELYVHTSNSDAVKIITIHKAKGLEFPAVVVPFLEINAKADDQVVVTQENESHLFYLKKKYADFSPSLGEIYRKEYLKSFIDELNSIYVAFTRAQSELYILVSFKAERGNNLATLLLPETTFERGKKLEVRKLTAFKAKTVTLEPSKYKDWIDVLKDEFADVANLASREYIVRGEVLHFILSLIGNTYQNDSKELVKRALEKAKARFSAIEDFKTYEKTINKILTDKNFKEFFEVEEGEIFCEKDLVDLQGNAKRIDRLIIKKSQAIIVDYKSSHEGQESHEEQVADYIKIIKSIYPKLKVKGVLMYLDDFSIKELT